MGGGGSDGGFTTSSEGAVTDGDQGGNINLTYQITRDDNLTSVAPNAMVISYCAPRIELRMDMLGPFASFAQTSLFTKEFNEAKPLSEFCKGVGGPK